MNSPFPGVDPYLEQYWGDIHTGLMVYIRDQIDEQLPGDLQARVEESVSIDQEVGSRWIFPDVNVSERAGFLETASAVATGIAVAEPLLVPLPSETLTQRHIEIVDKNSGNRVVTAIELLSPSNKVDEAGRNAYRTKQFEYIEGCVNLVEIDLIRSGLFMVAVPQAHIASDRRTPYIICVRRVTNRDHAEIYPIPIDQSVPNLRIPLRPSDADVILQLQPLLDQCYRRGRYGSIDYSLPPRPPLCPSDQEWAEQLLRKIKTH